MSITSLPGLYVHVPFCRSKCAYCDFYSVTDLSLAPAWLAALEQEAALYREQFAGFDTLYLGGGTPSLLSPAHLEALMASLRRHFVLAEDGEITLEANPDDLTREKIAAYRDLGFNRVSVGVQSFHDPDLAFLGRRHTAGQAVRALELLREAPWDNLSLDLMYALPGQSEDIWLATLHMALRFRPEHLSCYQLTVAAGTPLAARQAQGRFKPPGEAREEALFMLTSRFLEAHGYLHYEVSNFARGEALFSRHNRKYWEHAPYLGLGPGAHSFASGDGAQCASYIRDGARCAPYIKSGVRWWNFASLDDYLKALAASLPPVAGRETLTPEQLRLEALYLGFRTRRGVSLEDLRGFANQEAALAELVQAGLVEVARGRACPTRRGFLVADGLPLRFAD